MYLELGNVWVLGIRVKVKHDVGGCMECLGYSCVWF